MRRVCRVLLVAGLVLAMGGLVLAAEGKKEGKKPRPPRPEVGRPSPFVIVSGLILSDEQKAKLEELRKEYEPKLAEAQAKLESILTPEQKKLRQEAIAEAKKAGKRGRDLEEAIQQALKLTEEQQKQMQEARAQLEELNRTVREKIMALLTEEQKAELKKRFREGKGKLEEKK